MKKTVLFRLLRLSLLSLLSIMMLASCDPHQFPDMGVTLHLRFDTAWTHSEYVTGTKFAARLTRAASQSTKMRYIIRFYNYSDDAASLQASHYKEFVFYRDVTDDYDADFEITIARGRYKVLAWADFFDSPDNDGLYHDASNFAEITLLKPHVGNTDRRDAFRGTAEVKADEVTYDMAAAVVDMQRPLAKYEFVSTDLRDFTAQEAKKLAAKDATGSTSRAVDLSKYKVVFYYSGYMPSAYSMFTDRLVDSSTGISYEGQIKQLSDDELSLGFDYVLVNDEQTSITVRVALYNEEGTQVSLSSPINVPIWRSNHTVVRGRFLMQNTGGKIGIDPSYDGEYNLIINK